jgi:hypothetical protein
MKNAALLCLVLGLIAGPVYWVYAKFFTGSRLVLLDLKADGGVYRSPEFQLEPGMAPAGLILHLSTTLPGMPDDGSTPVNAYQVTLMRESEAAKPLGVSFKAHSRSEPNPSFREHLLYLKEVQGGRYRVEVTPKGEPEMPVSALRLEVRQHILEPDSKVVTAGMVLLTLGIITLVTLGS